jgi:hypothetical protein
VFDSQQLKLKAGQNLHSDRFRSVEVAVSFRRLTCYNCDLISVYKYRVKQLRRSPELAVEDWEPGPDEIEIWNSIPRFAEIPETIKCKRCGEVLGLFTSCIF